MREDRELNQYRDLMLPPSTFEDGFTLRSVIGCIFIGIVMMPAAMYLNLLAGGGYVNDAARWVTVILFVELARRSFTTLRRPEIFILFYMAGAAISSPFFDLLWRQYYVSSPAAIKLGVASNLPAWVAPGENVTNLRTFLHPDWLVPILLVALGNLLSRIDHFGLGYVLFRITSDVEKLPFPMAPVGAMGVTALADSSAGDTEGDKSWRWRVFAIGGMLGLVFGFFYLAIPSISGTFLKKPIEVLPVTFVDFTTRTEGILPATPVALSLNLMDLFVGMVLPYFAVLGSFIGMLITWIANPILYHYDQFEGWKPQMTATETAYYNYIDVYMSVGIGLSIAIAAIGFYHVYRSLRQRDTVYVQGAPPQDASQTGSLWHRLKNPPAGRGDFSIWIAIGIYVFSTLAYIVMCRLLVPGFPLWILLGYGFIYTPLISYVAARMEGIAGQWVEIPMVREATFILAHKYGGYHGVGIWFAPIPIHNYAGRVVEFRAQELTGTKFTSLIKAEFIIFPVVIIASLVFSQYLWSLAPIPSAMYLSANQLWELRARTEAITHSSTLGSSTLFFQAIKWPYIAGSATLGVVSYTVLSWAGAPIMLCYGLVRGLGTGLAAGLIPQMLGALIGRYFFEKRFGLKWRQYAPVLVAGFACGMGLISMLSLGFVLISKAVFTLPY